MLPPQAKLAGPRAAAKPELLPLRQVRLQAVCEVEFRHLKDLLAATAGYMGKACALSGLSRPRLYALLKKHRVSGVVCLVGRRGGWMGLALMLADLHVIMRTGKSANLKRTA